MVMPKLLVKARGSVTPPAAPRPPNRAHVSGSPVGLPRQGRHQHKKRANPSAANTLTSLLTQFRPSLTTAMTPRPAAVPQTPPITTPKTRAKRRPTASSSSSNSSINLKNKRRLPFREIPDTSPKPISWPAEFKRALPVGRPIRLDSTRLVDNSPFFQLLNYDCRRLIYDAFLKSRFRQHILCPSVARTGQTKEFFSHYTSSKTCPDSRFTNMLACGHWECLKSQDGEGAASDVRLADLVAFMRTSKFAYLEISEYIYRTMVFTFSSIPEMRAFVETTPETMLDRVRFVSFIAHTQPQDPQACQRFIKGEYFQTEAQGDAVALFGRFVNMERLEISFFPSLIIALSNQLREVVKPLAEIPESTEIVVRVPKMRYQGCAEVALPPVEALDNSGRFKLLRPVVTASDAETHCKAYSYQFGESAS